MQGAVLDAGEALGDGGHHGADDRVVEGRVGGGLALSPSMRPRIWIAVPSGGATASDPSTRRPLPIAGSTDLVDLKKTYGAGKTNLGH